MYERHPQTYAFFAALALLLTAGDNVLAQAGLHPNRGLWVGDVVLDQVAQASATKPEKSLEPTADTATMRVILHVDAQGTTHLLSHVALLKGAGTDERLFTDEQQLLEAIDQSKHTQQVIRRIETASYDLPRKTLPKNPPDEDFDPSTLKHEYETAHLLEGRFLPGETVKTRNDAMVIDRWHRSNPFRHPFHPNHTAGYRIVRDMQFTLDMRSGLPEVLQPIQAVEDLSGSYRETIQGLTKPGQPIVISGRFTLYRISGASGLDE